MALEIERKFLVRDTCWRDAVEQQTRLAQGYLAAQPNVTVRVRIAESAAWLTIKGAARGIARDEYEYPIPLVDAEAMLVKLSLNPPIEKVRYRVRCGAHLWDLDVFEGENSGLVLAEIELNHEDEPFERPAWVGDEVTGDPRYYNARLAVCPYRQWSD